YHDLLHLHSFPTRRSSDLNVGKTRNRGFEFTISTVNVEKGDFSWTTDLNWAANREEIVELLNGAQDMLAQRWFIGHSTSVYYQLDRKSTRLNSSHVKISYA